MKKFKINNYKLPNGAEEEDDDDIEEPGAD